MLQTLSVPKSNIRRSKLALAGAMLMILLFCVALVLQAISVQSVLSEVRSNDLARIALRGLLIDLIDAETGQRGFLLTGNEDYLEPYQRGRLHIAEITRKYRQPDFLYGVTQGERDQLMLLAQSKLDELSRTITLKRSGKVESAQEIVVDGYGKVVMDKVRDLVDKSLTRLRLDRDRMLDTLHDKILIGTILLVLIPATAIGITLVAGRSLTKAVRKNNELARRLSQEAAHDTLTGLPNRRFFDKWASYLIVKCTREKKPFTLMLLDLDGFKSVNDTFGHSIGDEVLKQAANRFLKTLRGSEVLARLGGDEFGLLVEGSLSRIELTSLGNRLINSLTATLHEQLPEGAVGTSIGVASFPQNGSNIETLIEAADAALYASKDGGRGIVTFAPASMVDTLSASIAVAAKLSKLIVA